MRNRNIVVTGSCEFEIQGVLSLLSERGIAAVRKGTTPLHPEDLLIVAISAEPLLGWGKHFTSLCRMKLQWHCSMIVLVPNDVSSVRLLEPVGCIVPGGYSLDWTGEALLYQITKWKQNKSLDGGNIRHISVKSVPDIDEVAYFLSHTLFISKKTIQRRAISKTEYGRRNRAWVNMGFCQRQQLMLFMCGIEPYVLLNLYSQLLNANKKIVAYKAVRVMHKSCNEVLLNAYI